MVIEPERQDTGDRIESLHEFFDRRIVVCCLLGRRDMQCLCQIGQELFGVVEIMLVTQRVAFVPADQMVREDVIVGIFPGIDGIGVGFDLQDKRLAAFRVGPGEGAVVADEDHKFGLLSIEKMVGTDGQMMFFLEFHEGRDGFVENPVGLRVFIQSDLQACLAGCVGQTVPRFVFMKGQVEMSSFMFHDGQVVGGLVITVLTAPDGLGGHSSSPSSYSLQWEQERSQSSSRGCCGSLLQTYL